MSPTPDKLELHGADQFETATEALEAIDADIGTIGYLVRIKHVLSKLPTSAAQPDRYNYYANGLQGARLKADIMMGLELLGNQADTPEQKMAAQALLEILREQ